MTPVWVSDRSLNKWSDDFSSLTPRSCLCSDRAHCCHLPHLADGEKHGDNRLKELVPMSGRIQIPAITHNPQEVDKDRLREKGTPLDHVGFYFVSVSYLLCLHGT